MNPRDALPDQILSRRHHLADWVTREYFERRPELRQRWGDAGLARCTEDTAFHLAYLAEAIRFDFPILFTDYLAWTKALLAALKISSDDLQLNLELTKTAFEKFFTSEEAAIACRMLDVGLNALPSLNANLDSHIKPENPFYDLAGRWLETLLNHDPRAGRRLILGALDEGVRNIDIYQHVFTPALYEVGRLWQTREISEAEEHYCSQTTSVLLAILSEEFPPARVGKSVVGFSVGKEMHEIGIRLVTDCFSQHGWDSVCLGSNVPTRNMNGVLYTWSPDLVAISATMTYHLSEMQAAIRAIRSSNAPAKPKILVGGKPFILCPELGPRIGADVTAHSCAEILSRTLEVFK
jgi:methanogenic corrinoid protein MtbC1